MIVIMIDEPDYRATKYFYKFIFFNHLRKLLLNSFLSTNEIMASEFGR